MNPTITVVVVDDDAFVRSTLAEIINGAPDMSCTSICANGAEAVETADQHQPDVILMDVTMPVMDGVEATRLIHHQHPSIKIVMWTSLEHDSAVDRALTVGASGFLLKSCGAQALLDSIRAMRWDLTVVASAAASQLTPPRAQNATASLKNPDRHILRLLSEGKTTAAIAQQLFMSEATVKLHLTNIMRTLHARNRVEAVATALRQGLL